nr:MAG TPA: hypothetical protein [Caudoviricetes sp.]
MCHIYLSITHCETIVFKIFIEFHIILLKHIDRNKLFMYSKHRKQEQNVHFLQIHIIKFTISQKGGRNQ